MTAIVKHYSRFEKLNLMKSENRSIISFPHIIYSVNCCRKIILKLCAGSKTLIIMFVLLIAILASSFSFGITEEKNIEDEYSEEYTDDKTDASLENEEEDCMPGGGGGMPPPPPPEGEFPEEATDARQRRGRSRSGRNRSRSQQRSQRSTQRPKTTPEGRETESTTNERQTAKAAKTRARARRTSRSIDESNMIQLSPLCEKYLKQTYESKLYYAGCL